MMASVLLSKYHLCIKNIHSSVRQERGPITRIIFSHQQYVDRLGAYRLCKAPFNESSMSEPPCRQAYALLMYIHRCYTLKLRFSTNTAFRFAQPVLD